MKCSSVKSDVSTAWFYTFNKSPMGLDALLENQPSHLPKFHIYSLSTSGVEIELIFTLGAAVSDTQADFQNCHIRA